MITRDAGAFLDAFARLPAAAPATARAAFLVSPLGFALADESARDNHYMDMAATVDARRALAQHAELARRLADDVPVISFPGDPGAPDGLFPNNVFATVAGRLIVGRMRHPVRQREATRKDIRAWFVDILGYAIDELPAGDYVAELTGSLAIDRARRVGFCGLSERCDIDGARAMHAAFGLELTYCFDLAGGEYHTNVVLAVLAGRVALLAGDGFADAGAVRTITAAYAGHVVALDPAQKRAFAANAIALAPGRVWMSTTAAASLSGQQVGALSSAGFAVGAVELDEIEKAGGSLRCCVAEIF